MSYFLAGVLTVALIVAIVLVPGLGLAFQAMCLLLGVAARYYGVYVALFQHPAAPFEIVEEKSHSLYGTAEKKIRRRTIVHDS